MRVIHKFVIQPGALSFIHTSSSVFIPRAVQEQGGALTLWVEVSDDYAGNSQRKIFALATGQPIPEGLSYVGTVQQLGLVWHIYASA